MKKLLINPSTELYFGNQLPIADLLLAFGFKKIILIADENIKDLHGRELARKINAELLTIPSGEKAKSFQTVQNLFDELSQKGCDRNTLFVALGGGVTTDLVGFIASVYMRGVPLILIPTTLLAIVDAAIGGKTGINTCFGKNLMGTIYPPQAIFADLDMLKTLPEKQWINGLAEILKMGLIYDSSIWNLSQKNEKDPDLIFKAIQGKIAIVGQDLTELGLRRILNFGHTIGHGLERVSEYTMSHGEAVALGSVVEAHLSMRLGYLAEKDFEEIYALYNRFSLSLPKGYSSKQLLAAMERDKKKASGKSRFVLIDKIGHAIPFEGVYCRAVTQSELEPTLHWMESWKLSL